jgi:branched-chain amino acid transport system permease protein
MTVYVQGIIFLISINLISVLGLSLLTGFTGSFCFGQAGFMAIGAYVSGMMAKFLDVPIPISVLCGMLAGGLISIPIGLPTLKLKGDYFAIATLGFAEAVRLVIENLQQFTGGSRGIPSIPTIKSPLIMVAIALVVFWLVRNYIKSRHGRNCIAIREDETAAQSIAINSARYKQISFFINGMLAGLAGALLAHYVGFIQPSMFGIPKSTELIIMLIFGGMHSLTGAALAVIILTSLPELLRAAAVWRLVLYGAMVVIIMIVRPEGLMGAREISLQWFRKFFKWLKLKFAPKAQE